MLSTLGPYYRKSRRGIRLHNYLLTCNLLFLLGIVLTGIIKFFLEIHVDRDKLALYTWSPLDAFRAQVISGGWGRWLRGGMFVLTAYWLGWAAFCLVDMAAFDKPYRHLLGHVLPISLVQTALLSWALWLNLRLPTSTHLPDNGTVSLLFIKTVMFGKRAVDVLLLSHGVIFYPLYALLMFKDGRWWPYRQILSSNKIPSSKRLQPIPKTDQAKSNTDENRQSAF